MDELSFDEIKNIEYSILTEVAQFCETNGIRYYLVCGTLLGAVRHKGFIPWDDDIDIGMPRPDYERFIKEFNSSEYVLHDNSIDGRYPYAFAKVSDPKTELTEEIEFPFPMGVYIDIFPIDGVPENEKEQKKFFRRIEWDMRLLSWKRISGKKKVGAVHKILQIIAKLLLKPVSMEKIVRRLDRDVKKYPYESASFVGHFVTKSNWGSDIKPKEIFGVPVKHVFEGGYFAVPSDYKKYLSLEYGDYMKLPPADKQVSNHDFTVRRVR